MVRPRIAGQWGRRLVRAGARPIRALICVREAADCWAVGTEIGAGWGQAPNRASICVHDAADCWAGRTEIGVGEGRRAGESSGGTAPLARGTRCEDGAVTTNDAEVEWLTVAGDPDVWRSIGLTVSADGLIPLFGTCLRIVEPGDDGATGLIGWAFSGITDTDDVAGFPVVVVDRGRPTFAAHDLGAAQLDHVVIFTGDMDAVSGAVESATGYSRASGSGNWARCAKAFTASAQVD